MTAATLQQRLENAEPVSIWPVPDLTVLNAGRRAPVAMPPELFGSVWPLLSTIAEGVCAPVDYPGIALLTSCASLIGGKRRVRPYDTGSWSEPCILWCGVVGDPSSRKSPALDIITGPLRTIEQDHAERHQAQLRAFKEDSEVAKATRGQWQDVLKKSLRDGVPTPPMPDGAHDPEEPVRRRTLVQDATPEAVGAILAGNPQGTLMLRDELAGWLTSFDRYAPGGREFWLEAFGGRSFTIDRKGSAKGPVTVPFNGVSVLGGIQPDKMAAALLSSPDDGLVARFLWSWPDKIGAIQRPRRTADLTQLEDLYRRLDCLPWGMGIDGEPAPVTLPLTATAADIFERWEQDNHRIDDDAAALYKSFVGKMNGAVLRLALVSELMCWAMNGGPEPREVSEDRLIAAAGWVDDYAKEMAQRVYGDAGLPKVERDAAILARYIRKQQFRRINKRTLKQSPHKSKLPGLRDAAAMDAVFEFLTDAGWLMADPSREGGAPGRPKLDYLVNPAVLGG